MDHLDTTQSNANYLAALGAHARLRDDLLIALDLRILSLGGVRTTYDHVFPLVSAPWLFRLLENGYALLFAQVLLVLVLLSTTQARHDLTRWLVVLFSGYAAGLVVFLAFPAVGPPIFHPESFSPEWRGTWTFQLMTALAEEYRRLTTGGRLSGFGYFVALPSLHVAAAIFLQHTMRGWPLVFWTWLPVTVLLCASTVVLGYHYFLDLPAGLALGLVLCWAAPVSVSNSEQSRGLQK